MTTSRSPMTTTSDTPALAIDTANGDAVEMG